MDVILTEVENGKSKFIFPSLPEEVKGTNRTNYQSYDILSCGEVKIPKGMKLTEVSFDGIFFGEAKKNESIVKQANRVRKNTEKLAGKRNCSASDGH